MRICVVIINYKTPGLTIDCIRSIVVQIDKSRDRIVVVDNNSGGEDLYIIKQAIDEMHLSDTVFLVPAPKNGGFAAGNNIGINFCKADFYLLANADTLFRPGAIPELLNAADEHPQAGIISPRLEWLDGEPQISCFNFPSPFSETINSAGTGIITKILESYTVPRPLMSYPTKPEWTSFACVLIRKEVFKTVGLLDEGYFMYYEDVDFCRQAWKAGFEVLNWPSARVVHLRGQSSGLKALAKEKKQLPAYFYKSRSRYFFKFYGSAGLLASNLCWLFGRCVSWPRETFYGKERVVSEHQFADIWKA